MILLLISSWWTSKAVRRPAALALSGALAAGLPAAAVPPAVPDSPAGAFSTDSSRTFRVEHEGIAVELSLVPLAGGRLEEKAPVAVRLEFRDSTTGAPLAGLDPGAWMDLVPASADDGARACKDKIETFLEGSLFSAPEVSLNSFYILALNADPSIAVLDPLLSFGGSRLLAMIELSSPGDDWVLGGGLLFVSLPDTGRVAVIDTATWKPVAEVATGGRPSQLALSPDGRNLWVADGWAADDRAEAASGVAVIDTRRLSLASRIETGPGPHELALSSDGRLAFVTNQGAGTLSIIDGDRLVKVKDLATGPRPVSVAYSELSQAAYVADAEAGTVTAVDRERLEVVAVDKAEKPGLSTIRFAPGGRLGFVLNPATDAVHVLDAARNRIVQTADALDEPDQVSFSAELAYVRHRGSDTVLMIPLATLGEEGRPVAVVSFPGGQKPFGAVTLPSRAAGIVPADGPAAMLVTNPGDRMIYYYKEGTAAPMGSFKAHGREPRAALVVDRSLAETAPGVYETTARLGRPGRYDLALFVATPRVAHCFPFAVGANPELERRRLAALGARVEFLEAPSSWAAGRPSALRFRLSDPQSGEPALAARDVAALTFLVPGTWQQRSPAREVGGGVYEIELTLPAPGSYVVQIEAQSLKVRLGHSPPAYLEVVEPSAAGDGLIAETQASGEGGMR